MTMILICFHFISVAKLKQYDNNFKQTTQQAVNGNNNAYHVSNQVASTTNDQNKNNTNSNIINNNEISAPPPPPPNHSQVKNYWNNTIAGNEFGYQSSLQHPQTNSSNRSPVEIAYGTPPMLCYNQNQNANSSDLNRDMFVRSDSILTDDDYVPFDAPAQSKFGPISRMTAKTSPYSTGTYFHTFFILRFFFYFPLLTNETNISMKIELGLSTDSLNTPNANNPTSSSADPSVWLYNNLQKSPNQYSYQTNDLNPMLNDNMSRDGNLFFLN